tara:strand:+ start:2375 stop:2827 length:453 start_codon:yes stop_codon:yes gene_type:complete
MKKLKQYIKEEINRLVEEEYDAPTEILDSLKNTLELYPLKRYVSYLKAVNSIPPSYEVFLHNGTSFFIIYEDFALMAKIEDKEYYLAGDVDEINYAVKHINRLLTQPQMKSGEGEEEAAGEDAGGDTGGDAGGAPPLPLPPLPEPPEEEA